MKGTLDYIKQRFCNRDGWRDLIEVIGYVCLFLLVGIIVYPIMKSFGVEYLFIVFPLVLSFVVSKVGYNFNIRFSSRTGYYVTIMTLIIFYFSKWVPAIRMIYEKKPNLVSIGLVILFSSSRLWCSKNQKVNGEEKEKHLDLFNLLYVNTSKVHEIAMLIDNKVMKTVERELTTEELLKSTSTYGGNFKKVTSGISVEKEETSSKRVYENFDVKMTTSIMLRKIYDKIKKNSSSKDKAPKLGQLIMFNEIGLERRNVDDTVFLLNILQDSKIKNQGNDEIEINMNKMMEKMLDDFTIDYVFKQEDKNYILQLPYNSNESFENGYHHNDLQLGKLSLIGIYRGEIDFSQKESVSSKFLDIMSSSYNYSVADNQDEIMKTSIVQAEQQTIPFNFEHRKLKDNYHLIDVIAIIQELNIEGD